MKQLGKGLGLVLLLAACSAPTLSETSGRMRMAVQWPQAGFRTQAIPAETRSMTVSISGQGLAQSLARTLTRGSGDSQTLELQLPLGSKQVEVKAFNGAGDLVAEDRQQVEIQANQTARLEMSLQAVSPVQPQPGNGNNPGNGGPTVPLTNGDGGPGSPSGNSSSSPDSPTASSEPSSAPSTSPSTAPTAGPTAQPASGGGGGGGGSGSSTAAITASLSADPTTISGMGFSTQLKINFSDANYAAAVASYLNSNPTALSWTCVDSTSTAGCGAFGATSDKLRWTWTSPGNQAGNFTLSFALTDQTGQNFNGNVMVTVNQGSGSLGLSNGGFDGGETGPAS